MKTTRIIPSLLAIASVAFCAGGYGSAELVQAGAFRVYRDAAELHESLDEIGIP